MGDFLLLPYPTETGLVLGEGWDLNRGRRTFSRCVDETDSAVEDSATKLEIPKYFDSDERVDYAYDLRALDRLISLHHEATVKAPLAPKLTGDFGSKLDISSHLKESTSSETYVATMTLRGGPDFTLVDPRRFQNIRLGKGATDRARCGTGFVAAIISGAQFQAILNFDNLSREEKLDIRTELSGGVTIDSASATAKLILTRNQKNNQEGARFHYTVIQRGGLPAQSGANRMDSSASPAESSPGQQELSDQVAELRNAIATFKATASSNPKPIQFVYVPYSVLDASVPATSEEARLRSQIEDGYYAYRQLLGDVIDFEKFRARTFAPGQQEVSVRAFAYYPAWRTFIEFDEALDRARRLALLEMRDLQDLSAAMDTLCHQADRTCKDILIARGYSSSLAKLPTHPFVAAFFGATLPPARADLPEAAFSALKAESPIEEVRFALLMTAIASKLRWWDLERCKAEQECLTDGQWLGLIRKLQSYYGVAVPSATLRSLGLPAPNVVANSSLAEPKNFTDLLRRTPLPIDNAPAGLGFVTGG